MLVNFIQHFPISDSHYSRGSSSVCKPCKKNLAGSVSSQATAEVLTSKSEWILYPLRCFFSVERCDTRKGPSWESKVGDLLIRN